MQGTLELFYLEEDVQVPLLYFLSVRGFNLCEISLQLGRDQWELTKRGSKLITQ